MEENGPWPTLAVWWPVCWGVCVCDRSVPCACRSQAAELGEFTAKIALLEEAKRKKEEEATEWQHKVTVTSSTSL